MTLPTYQDVMLPVLQAIATASAMPVQEVVSRIETHFRLSPTDREQLLPSGRQRTIVNRVYWCITYMVQAGLIERPGRGTVRITDRGREALALKPERIDVPFLLRYPEFQAFRERSNTRGGDGDAAVSSDTTPEESLESTFQSIRAAVEEELLDRVLAAPPAFFEQLVIELLMKMGYGGGNPGEAGRRVGRSGDDGIDGVIDEDRLGLDAVYIQAKRWARDHPVRRPDLQAFAGSLEGQRASKGVFITTSRFTADATEYVDRITRRIRLIDGQTLARLMYDHGVGTRPVRTYELRRVDTGYFEEQA
jgi:restriction system protein